MTCRKHEPVAVVPLGVFVAESQKIAEKFEAYRRGAYANAVGQPVLYVTERAVFKLTPEGLELIEVAPGIDIEKDVLAYMDFKPIVKDVKLMDARIFEDKPMGLEL